MIIKLLDSTDNMVEVWEISRPYVIDSKTSKNDLLKMNLPINQFKNLTLYIKSSILFRDLLFTFRPVSEWARSNRTIRFNKDNLFLASESEEFTISVRLLPKLYDIFRRIDKGEKQDYVKKDLPLMTETEFCINVNYRTLMNILYTFEIHCNDYFKIFKRELCKLPEHAFNENDYQISNKSDLFDDVALTEDELKLPESVNKIGSTNVIKVNITANLMAQFIRQHSSTIKNGLWNLVDKDFHKIVNSTCSINVDCVAILSDRKLRNLTSVRTCWFAQFDKVDNSSWNYVLGNYVKSMTPKDFLRQLPCKGNCKDCKILKDMLPRIQHTEVNPPCPILTENPYIIDQRIKQYNSESVIMDKWKDSKSLIHFNPANEYNRLYSSIDLEAGTNVKK